MPYRRIPIVQGEIYHVFNRAVARQPIFLNRRDYRRAIEVFSYYSYRKPRIRFSHYNRLPETSKAEFLTDLRKSNQQQIQLLAFCLMPNHVHFLIKETTEGGISNFMRNFQNSYAKYFNLKTERSGALLQSMFKAVMIESEEQLLHVWRYIHLNPWSSHLCKDLENYEWSSLADYVKGKSKSEVLDVELISGLFSSRDQLTHFILDQTDYQGQLEHIKHVVCE